MFRTHRAALARHWQEIAAGFLKLGATSYGGPAMMGIMQVELQDKRHWLSTAHFLEELSLVNMVPGTTAAQLGILLGHARGGWWGGLLVGRGCVLPGFYLMLMLRLTSAHLGATPPMRRGLSSLGPGEP
jgi:chromate transporter